MNQHKLSALDYSVQELTLEETNLVAGGVKDIKAIRKTLGDGGYKNIKIRHCPSD